MKYDLRLLGFATNLGWIGLLHQNLVIQSIAIGYKTKQDLARRKEFANHRFAAAGGQESSIIEQLSDFAAGEQVYFDNLELETSHFSSFQNRVTQQCRLIPYGATVTYGELARYSGSPNAFRAVGSVMSNNPFPIVVPCHRVIAANRKIGGFSSPQGVKMKIQMLKLENSLNQLGDTTLTNRKRLVVRK